MNNTIKRSLSGLVFLAIMTGGLLWNPVIFALLMVFCIVVMMHEFLTISTGKSLNIPSILSILTGVTLFSSIFLFKGYGFESGILFASLIPAAAMGASFLYNKEIKASYTSTGFHYSAILYVALPFALMNFIVFDDSNIFAPKLLLAMFILLWSSDVGAYVFGMTIGQKYGKKLFPSISPKKSWAGFWGGITSTLLAGYIIYYLDFTPISLIHIIAISLIINILGVLGDLVESQFKRNFGVKDSGNIMPGHGGLLDRFDGALLSFPVALAYLKLFALI